MENQNMTLEEMLQLLEKMQNKSPEELRECIPQSKLRYWGTQKSLYDYCDKYRLFEGESYLYVLKCAEDLYYIGETNRIFQRFREHFAPSGKSAVSATAVYEPQSVYEIILLGEMDKSQRLVYEDALTVEYANKYTIYQVRGGHFSHYDIQKAYSAKKLQSHWLYEEHGRLRFMNPYYNRILSAINQLQKFPRIHPKL